MLFSDKISSVSKLKSRMSSEKWDQERSRDFYFNSDWVVWCPEACEGEHPIESTYTVVRASTLSGANIEHIKNTGVILAWTNTIFSHHLLARFGSLKLHTLPENESQVNTAGGSACIADAEVQRDRSRLPLRDLKKNKKAGLKTNEQRCTRRCSWMWGWF